MQSDAFATSCWVEHKKIIGLIKSLEAAGVEMVTSAAKDHTKLALTPEAEAYITAGSPEAQAFAAVPAEVRTREHVHQSFFSQRCHPFHAHSLRHTHSLRVILYDE